MRPLASLLGVLLVGAPLATRAAPDGDAWTLRGDDACRYGARDCNRCVEDVVESVRALRPRPTARVRYSSMAERSLPPFGRRLAAFGANGSHLQGIARIPGLPGEHWLVASRARPGRIGGGGFFLVELGDVPGRDGAPFGTAVAPVHTVRLDPERRRTTHYYPMPGVDHPGGMQMLGTTLALAASCAEAPGCDGRSFVELHDLRTPGASATLVLRHRLFRQGEPHRHKHASAVAIARLADDRHLMYVHGKDDRPEGWFYRSLSPGLTSGTRWRFVEHFLGAARFGRGYQNVAMLTECGTRELYLLGTGNPRYGEPVTARSPLGFVHGLASLFSSGRASRGREVLDLFRLERLGGALRAEHVHAARFEPDRSGYCSFRAGASVHVTPEGGIALYCTAHKANTDLLGDPDSKLKLLELAH